MVFKGNSTRHGLNSKGIENQSVFGAIANTMRFTARPSGLKPQHTKYTDAWGAVDCARKYITIDKTTYNRIMKIMKANKTDFLVDSNGNFYTTGGKGDGAYLIVLDLPKNMLKDKSHSHKPEKAFGYDSDKERYAKERLEYLRGEILAERISMEEIAELESLAEYIEPGDVLLLQWANVPEFDDEC